MADIKVTAANWPAISKEAQAEIVYDVVLGGHRGDLMSKDLWLESVEGGMFIDYDGYGDVIDENGEYVNYNGISSTIKPSEADRWPSEGTHILWYNR